MVFVCPNRSTFLLHLALCPKTWSLWTVINGLWLSLVNRKHQQKMGVRLGHSSPPGSLPAGPQVDSDYFPLPKPIALAKGPLPVPKDLWGHTPCLVSHLLPTPLNDPFIMLFFITLWEFISDSCKDLNQQGSHHHHYHRPRLPLGTENCRKAFGSAVSLTLLGQVVCQDRTVSAYRRNIRPTRD